MNVTFSFPRPHPLALLRGAPHELQHARASDGTQWKGRRDGSQFTWVSMARSQIWETKATAVCLGWHAAVTNLRHVTSPDWHVVHQRRAWRAIQVSALVWKWHQEWPVTFLGREVDTQPCPDAGSGKGLWVGAEVHTIFLCPLLLSFSFELSFCHLSLM